MNNKSFCYVFLILKTKQRMIVIRRTRENDRLAQSESEAHQYAIKLVRTVLKIKYLTSRECNNGYFSHFKNVPNSMMTLQYIEMFKCYCLNCRSK